MNDKDKRIERLEGTLQIVDRHMSGNDSYEGIWVNYPDKPEQSPASVVREALADDGADGGDKPIPSVPATAEDSLQFLEETGYRISPRLVQYHHDRIRRHLTAPPENLPHFDYRKGPEVCTEAVRISTYTCPYCNNRVNVESGPETAPPTVPEAVRRLVERWRNDSRENIVAPTTGRLMLDRCADELDRAIAQHSEPDDDWMGPTRMPETQSVNTTTADKLRDPGNNDGNS